MKAVQQHLARAGALLEGTAGLQQRAALLLPATHPEQQMHAEDHDAEDHEVGANSGSPARDDTDFEDAHEELTSPGEFCSSLRPVAKMRFDACEHAL